MDPQDSQSVSQQQWRAIVEAQTGFSGRVAISRRRGEEALALLAAHAVAADASPQKAVEVAISLARELYALGPLRRWITLGRASPQAVVASAAATTLLRRLSFSFRGDIDVEVADALLHGEPDLVIVLRLLAGSSMARERPRAAEVYLSAPVSARDPATEELLGVWWPRLEQALEVAGRRIGLDLFLRGPGSMRHDPRTQLLTARSGLRHSVLHLVVGAKGGSTGIGRELDASLSRRRPVLWLLPPGENLPHSVEATNIEAQIRVRSIADIEAIVPVVVEEVERAAIAIWQVWQEKDAMLTSLLELQTLLRRRWMQILEPDQRQALIQIRLSAPRALALLTEPFTLYHETSFSELYALASILGVEIFGSRSESRKRPFRQSGAA